MSEKVPERGTLELGDPQQLLQQAFQVFFNPEIERRREAGLIDTSFGISVAQVVFNEDERWEVRFNDEVDGHIEAVAPVEIDAGQEVLMSMIGEITAFDLTEDDPNAAHITVFYRGERDGWLVISDLRFNATLAGDHIDAAREFFEVAAKALEANALRAFSENLLAATELAAKAALLSVPVDGTRRAKSHRFIQSAYNRHASLGNAEPRYVRVFNQLRGLRRKARYLQGVFDLRPDDAAEMLAVAREMLADVDEHLPTRVPARKAVSPLVSPTTKPERKNPAPRAGF
jgi:uncharacterized protein (UPF0332 family)